MSTEPGYEGWAIVELMGHRRLAGHVSQVEMFGQPMMRLDLPAADGGTSVTQYYSGHALYGVTPTSEEVVRAAARAINHVEPVTRWELPAAVVDGDETDEDSDVDW